jgi:hypothetical protein
MRNGGFSGAKRRSRISWQRAFAGKKLVSECGMRAASADDNLRAQQVIMVYTTLSGMNLMGSIYP